MWIALALAGCGQVGTDTLAGGGTTDSVAPTITTQPSSQSVAAGETASFAVAATGSDPLTYQWHRDGAPIAGAVDSTYSTSADVADDGASFSVVVSNAIGTVQSATAKLTVTATAVAPTITTQPGDQSITVGQTATFSVTASGSTPLSYQWHRNGNDIAGATGASYTTAVTSSADNGATFSVTVSNSAGSVLSRSANLVVGSASGGAVAPSISVQPADQSIKDGQTATFTVTAGGTAPLAYQWRKNGGSIAGATGASYTTPAAHTSDSGAAFDVKISNSAGGITSRAAKLTVSAVAPAISTQPADQSVAAGATATFSVVASGTAPLSYQWSKNGSAISGATTASYSTPAAASGDNGATFQVKVSNSAGSITSRAAKLTVTAAAPTIATQPADLSVRVGQTATFSVVAGGGTPLSYQWSRNGNPISGASGSSYTTPTLAGTDNGSTFQVKVSNSAGSINSRMATLTVSALTQGTDVTMYKNNLARTGANLSETTLTPGNVNSTTFGKLRMLATDGKVDAQPLYVSALSVNGVSHNVVYVATEADSVYAYDADSGALLWHTSLVPAGETVNDMPPQTCDQVVPTIGVTSTPVIDRTAGVIYVVAMSQTSGAQTWHHRLHALDLATGTERNGGPREVAATYPYAGGTLTFDPVQYKARAGLLLLNGNIYTMWTSHCDHQFYTGWIIAYSAATLQPAGVFNISPNSSGLGPTVWMSGGAPAVDSAGNMYVLTSNGTFDQTLNSQGFPNLGDYGNAFMKITTSGGMGVSDYFALKNTVDLSSVDLDLGSGSVMLLPDQADSGGTVRHLAVGAGKDGNIYLVDRDAMGHFSTSSNNIWQQLTALLGNRGQGGANGGIWSTPAYFNGRVYFGINQQQVVSFTFSNAKLGTSFAASTSVNFAYPGASPAISANGTSNGIVWACQSSNPAVLYAFDAGSLATLYSSSQAAGNRDQFGAGTKFIVPTIADGKVFMGAQTGVAVFGLL